MTMDQPSTQVSERDICLGDGRTLHVYDTGHPGDRRRAVVWHHGTPNIGAPPAPLFADAARLQLRWIGYDRPGYGGSTAAPGRAIATAAHDTAQLADALGVDTFAVMGHSGGAPHALACAALLPDRVVGAVGVAGLAPYDAPGLEWFAGMAASGVASLHAAAAGRVTKEHHEATGAPYDPEFTQADIDALQGPWGWLESVVGPAVAAGPAALIDDDLAYVADWGFAPEQITVPTLLLHGDQDRIVPVSHSVWLAVRCAAAELRVIEGAGHISVLESAPAALVWIGAQAS